MIDELSKVLNTQLPPPKLLIFLKNKVPITEEIICDSIDNFTKIFSKYDNQNMTKYFRVHRHFLNFQWPFECISMAIACVLDDVAKIFVFVANVA